MIGRSGPPQARWLVLLLPALLLLAGSSAAASGSPPTRLHGSHACVVVAGVNMATAQHTPMVQHPPTAAASTPGAHSQAQAQRKLQSLPGLAQFKQRAPEQLQKELEQLGIKGQPSPSPHLSLQDVAGRKLLGTSPEPGTVPGLAAYAAQAGPELQQQLGQLGALQAPPAPMPALQDVNGGRKLLQATAGDVRGLAEYAQNAPQTVQQQLALLGVVPGSPSPSPSPSPSSSPLLSDLAARRLLQERAGAGQRERAGAVQDAPVQERAAPVRKSKVDVAVPGLQQWAQKASPQVQKQLAQLGLSAAAPGAQAPAAATIQQVVPPAVSPPAITQQMVAPAVSPPADNGTRRLDEGGDSAAPALAPSQEPL